MAMVLGMKIHELASVLTLLLLLACWGGLVKLCCKVDAGMSNPTMWATGGGVTRYGTQRGDSSGGANDGSTSGLNDPRAASLGLQGFVSPARVNGFTVGGHEPPTFWNPGDYAEVAAQQSADVSATRSALLAGTLGGNLMSGGNAAVIAANQASMEGMLQPNY
jgi:hypothetical protein